MTKIALFAGLVIAAISGYLVWQKLEEAEATMAPVSYLTFSIDFKDEVLFAGDIIKAEHLGTIQLPNGYDVFGLETQLIEDTPSNRDYTIGRKLNTAIPRGRVLSYDLIENIEVERLDQVIRHGFRAVSLSVSATNSLSNRVVPGNRIDLLGFLKDSLTPQATMVLEDVKVLAVGKSLSVDDFQSNGERRYSNITIEVSLEQANILTTWQQNIQGDFIFLLRNQCDTATPDPACE